MGTNHAKKQAKQLLHLCQVNGALDDNRIRQVVRALLTAGHRNCPRILDSFVRLVSLHRRQHSLTVESATPLPADLQEEIRTALARSHGQAGTTTFIQRPSLIGGIRVQAGWNVYDGTIAAQLEKLAKAF